MAHFAHTMPFGAHRLNSQQTRFSIWAPDMEQVTLEISGEQPLSMEFLPMESLPMNRSADGVHSGVAEVSEGAAYQYRVSPNLAVPDPASRQQQGDVHGPSLVVDPRAYNWQNTAWAGRPWQEMVIYEMHAGCYGGFAAMESELPRLVELGITAIELMPIADFSGQRNWGYDGVLPYAPATAYGSPAELKHLIDTAHGCGLCIYLDVVYNHFGPDGNYLHAYASKFFSQAKPSPWGPSIDFSQKPVREFFTHNALYWLMEYRFDGLRFDAVHAIADPGWLDEMAADIRECCEPGRHIHLMLENEKNTSAHLEQDFDAQWNDDIHNVIHVMLTSEHEGYYSNYQNDPAQKLARALAEGFIYQGEPMPNRDNRPRGTPSAHLPPYQFIFFLQNHDQVGNRAMGERLTVLAQPEALRAAITLQLLSPQIPLLFMGEERGVQTPFLFFTDFHGNLAAAVRDGRREEFRAFSHFANLQAQAEIPDPNLLETFTRSTNQLKTGTRTTDSPNTRTTDLPNKSYEDFYRELLNLRHKNIVPHLNTAKSNGARAIGDSCVVAEWQLTDDKVMHMIVNLGKEEVSIDELNGDLLFESKTGAGENARAGRAMPYATSVFVEYLQALGPYGVRVQHKLAG